MIKKNLYDLFAQLNSKSYSLLTSILSISMLNSNLFFAKISMDSSIAF